MNTDDWFYVDYEGEIKEIRNGEYLLSTAEQASSNWKWP